MQSFVEFSGSICVAHGTEIVMETAAGTADLGTGAACSSGTRFQIASVSKQFTAAAAMLLVEEEKLDLHAPIASWLDGRWPRWSELTLHQLLSHTSGLGHWWVLPDYDISDPDGAQDLLERFSILPLRSTPGTQWEYSSPGYLLTAWILEQASGLRYADFLTSRLLRPLGMDATHGSTIPRDPVARGYRGRRRVDVPSFAALPGAGDIWATAADLVRYTTAFNAGRVVAASSRDMMTTIHASALGGWGTDSLVAAEGCGYGYLLGTLAGQPMRFHPGDNPGYQAFLGWLPQSDLTIAILSNQETTDIADVLRHVLSHPRVAMAKQPCRSSPWPFGGDRLSEP
ncbi:beta-lactamase family protein [Streptomyces sp. PTM05]|uniref:Beta-lactamase family protein n=1 Tax=Streptantibioticus parmotrematis TaxID=2873249 RepID=A0ABS7QNW4_9ACTN|nr:serine hydrolase domain-containing protein [Streptantibioticus parmotrematis]MBY8884461.1 beta-lactamase family protein [Streptantibioticus parmotrematis]